MEWNKKGNSVWTERLTINSTEKVSFRGTWFQALSGTVLKAGLSFNLHYSTQGRVLLHNIKSHHINI